MKKTLDFVLFRSTWETADINEELIKICCENFHWKISRIKERTQNPGRLMQITKKRKISALILLRFGYF